ncbi:hypothetical protein GOBAR_AA22749 [Gossypium barbadense]|uniref:Uncharacterized protein n=1 Tax=Gossypium barbadense TaxID=3634 RepID=A0A2P5X3N3_GOSBA|nr:hypothetical protein GOBAR_AA22749 [Gossypium barbadense]
MLNLEEMLTKFISVSETRFQNTDTVLMNQQASIQGLETQIGQLAKLISERPQGSLPSNTKANPREQINAIIIQDAEGLVAPEPEPRQETRVSKGKGEVDHNDQKPMPNAVKFLKELLTNKRKLDEVSHVELNKSKTPNKPKLSQDELNTSPSQLNVGDKVLLDVADPRITTPEPNEEIPLTVLSIFPFGTVEVIHPKFGLSHPHGQGHMRALGHAHTIGGDTAVRYGRVKTRRETCPYLKTVVETENVTQTYDTPVPSTRGQHFQNEHGRGPMYTGVGEANEARHGRATIPCAPRRLKNIGMGRMSDAFKFKIYETHGQILGHTGVSHGRVP